jgi:chromosome segregation ATPase
MIVWIVLIIPLVGATLAIWAVRRADQPAKNAKVQSLAPMSDVNGRYLGDLVDLTSRQSELELASAQTRQLTLQFAALRNLVEREVGDARRTFNDISSRFERMAACEELLQSMDAEIEQLHLSLDLSVARIENLEDKLRVKEAQRESPFER